MKRMYLYRIILLLICIVLSAACRNGVSDGQTGPLLSAEQTNPASIRQEPSETPMEESVSVMKSEEPNVPEQTLPPTPAPTDTPSPTPAPTDTPTPAPTATPEPEKLREDLSSRCKFSCTQKSVSAKTMTDDSLKTSVILADKTELIYTWSDHVPADALYLFSFSRPDAFRITQWDGAGNMLSEEEVKPSRMCLSYPLKEGCRKVTVHCVGRCKVNSFQIFGEGNAFPQQVVYWTEPETRDHCDLMLVSTHFDDEILMMGGVLPIYAGEQKRDCVVVYMKGTDKIRKLEAIQGLWEMGVRREPVCLSCSSDSLQKALDNDAAGVFEKDNLERLVALLRRYRPLVVVTHDVNGEYGHESHVKTSALVRRAVELASDPSYDPESAAQYGVWQVQKEYIHLWKENPLELDTRSPLPHMGNRSAYAIAEKAFTYHKTQQKNWSVKATDAKYPIGSFGLYFTAVGPDSGVNDMFENTGFPQGNKPSEN